MILIPSLFEYGRYLKESGKVEKGLDKIKLSEEITKMDDEEEFKQILKELDE